MPTLTDDEQRQLEQLQAKAAAPAAPAAPEDARPAPPAPRLGATVFYTLSEGDAVAINRQRQDYTDHLRSQEDTPATGYQGHAGNFAREGDVCPAHVVKVVDESSPTANLQVLLDGTDSYWATSRAQGLGAGTYALTPEPEDAPADAGATHVHIMQ